MKLRKEVSESLEKMRESLENFNKFYVKFRRVILQKFSGNCDVSSRISREKFKENSRKFWNPAQIF